MFFQACLDGIDAPFSKDDPSVNKVVMCMDLRLQNTGKHLPTPERWSQSCRSEVMPTSTFWYGRNSSENVLAQALEAPVVENLIVTPDEFSVIVNPTKALAF